VHEATFCEEELDRAQETLHSTALGAASVAVRAGVILLALNHLSGRYSGREVEAEARAAFANTVVPRDFDVIAIPFPERGQPELIARGARSRPAGIGSEA
jgi:ribonuclease Z